MHFFIPHYQLLNLAETARTISTICCRSRADVRDALAWSKYLNERCRCGGKAQAMCGQHHWPSGALSASIP